MGKKNKKNKKKNYHIPIIFISATILLGVAAYCGIRMCQDPKEITYRVKIKNVIDGTIEFRKVVQGMNLYDLDCGDMFSENKPIDTTQQFFIVEKNKYIVISKKELK